MHTYHRLQAYVVFLLCFVLQTALAIDSRASTQYIWYNGTLTGRYIAPSTSNCSSFDLTKMGNATMAVGVNPPWDVNPFYWQIRNTGTQVSPGAGQSCFGIGGCTADSIFNFYFATADFQCFKNGQKCGSLVFSPFYYEALQMVDLSNAAITPFSDGALNGYNVIGNPGKYVSNGTVTYDFDFQPPRNYRTTCPAYGTSGSVNFPWLANLTLPANLSDRDRNEINPFSYALNFTNTTMSANLTVTAPLGTVVMLFSGNRQDDRIGGTSSNTKNGNDPFNNGNYTAIALDTSNPNKPQFTFANGSRIKFEQRTGNEYFASAVSGTNDGRQAAEARWTGVALIFMVAFFYW